MFSYIISDLCTHLQICFTFKQTFSHIDQAKMMQYRACEVCYSLRAVKCTLHNLYMQSKMHKGLFSSGFLSLQTSDRNSYSFYDTGQLAKKERKSVHLVFVLYFRGKHFTLPLNFSS